MPLLTSQQARLGCHILERSAAQQWRGADWPFAPPPVALGQRLTLGVRRPRLAWRGMGWKQWQIVIER
jgi:hypothetical protein